MNNPGSVNGKSETGSSTAGGSMQKSGGSMSKEGGAMKSGSANGQEPSPANPKPGQ
ncbi:hypothetical protein [Methylobacterium brachythecii]|uniref:hypothetical protein n=1 Tax=Methylobacterium brachythecii TaxID=1176177 RepID=UPI00160FC38A|nr:hypothetical protein [Methylobacterium brachythecii]